MATREELIAIIATQQAQIEALLVRVEELEEGCAAAAAGQRGRGGAGGEAEQAGGRRSSSRASGEIGPSCVAEKPLMRWCTMRWGAAPIADGACRGAGSMVAIK